MRKKGKMHPFFLENSEFKKSLFHISIIRCKDDILKIILSSYVYI